MDNETGDWEDDDDMSCDCAGLEDVLSPAQKRKAKEREERLKLRTDKKRTRKQKKKNESCNNESMNCFVHDNSHWKTPPYWKYGPFCFCSNANNNTYWCLRTINQSHDFVYCEFITTFMSYYDLKTDPYQLNNTVLDLSHATVQLLHDSLKQLKQCAGSKDCYHSSSQHQSKQKQDLDWPGMRNLKKKKSSRKLGYSRNYFQDDQDVYRDNVYDKRSRRYETRYSDLDYE